MRSLDLLRAFTVLLLMESSQEFLQPLPIQCRPGSVISRASEGVEAIRTGGVAGATTRKEELKLFEGDVVMYRRPGGPLELGVITWERKIHPLCRRAQESPAFYYDEHQDSLQEPPEQLVVRLVNSYFEQRIVEDRKINPHGEEAEEVFFITEPLPPDCLPPVRN